MRVLKYVQYRTFRSRSNEIFPAKLFINCRNKVILLRFVCCCCCLYGNKQKKLLVIKRLKFNFKAFEISYHLKIINIYFFPPDHLRYAEKTECHIMSIQISLASFTFFTHFKIREDAWLPSDNNQSIWLWYGNPGILQYLHRFYINC